MPKLTQIFEELSTLGIVKLGKQPIGPDTEVLWNRNIVEVGREALAEDEAPSGRGGATESRSEVHVLTIDFPREDGTILSLTLPTDLTVEEGTRLADIVRALGRTRSGETGRKRV
jgi:hypothetical protein